VPSTQTRTPDRACESSVWGNTLAITDVIAAAAFFGWANRLMLSLGEAAAISE
jgi:alkylhydroperoxidase family enzyme